MIEPAGAPVTMISVGSGSSCFLEPNQLQADRQANVISTKTFNRYALVPLQRYERIMQLRYQASYYPLSSFVFNIDRPGSKLRGFFQPPASVAQWRSPEKAAVFAAELRGAFIAHPIRRDGHIDIAE